MLEMKFCNKILTNGPTHEERKVVVKVEDENEAFSKTRIDRLVKMFEEKMVLNEVKQARISSPKRVG